MEKYHETIGPDDVQALVPDGMTIEEVRNTLNLHSPAGPEAARGYVSDDGPLDAIAFDEKHHPIDVLVAIRWLEREKWPKEDYVLVHHSFHGTPAFAIQAYLRRKDYPEADS